MFSSIFSHAILEFPFLQREGERAIPAQHAALNYSTAPRGKRTKGRLACDYLLPKMTELWGCF
jgi:hypothetical protein